MSVIVSDITHGRTHDCRKRSWPEHYEACIGNWSGDVMLLHTPIYFSREEPFSVILPGWIFRFFVNENQYCQAFYCRTTIRIS